MEQILRIDLQSLSKSLDQLDPCIRISLTSAESNPFDFIVMNAGGVLSTRLNPLLVQNRMALSTFSK